MAASSMFMRVALLMVAAALVLVPFNFLVASAETVETKPEETKVDVHQEESKEALPTVPETEAAQEPPPQEPAAQEPPPQETAAQEPPAQEPPPVAEKSSPEGEAGKVPTDESFPAPAEEAEEENTSPLNRLLPEQIFYSVSEHIKYVFNLFMMELKKEIDLYSYKEETNISETVENNETAVTVKELPANETQVLNATLEAGASNDAEKNETSVKKPRFHCTGKNITENTTGTVQMVNSTTLLQRLAFENNSSGSECILVFFYAPWCHFSALAASSYNTLGRAYPQLDIMAVDAVQFSSLNARFGVVSVPNIIFFHQSKSVVRFNSSKKTFENMVLFVKNMTGLEADKSVEVSEQDLIGPIASLPTSEPDYLLWLSWMFINVCSLYMFYLSSVGQQLINKVHILWQEHQHIE